MDLPEQIAREFNHCIAAAGLQYPIIFRKEDLAATKKIITTAPRSDAQSLGRLFFQNFFPQYPWTEYHHFTRLGSFENMIATERIYLSSVFKRFRQEEFQPFYDDHELDGYKRRLAAGISMAEQFVKDTFFLSLTGGYLDPTEEDELWDTFAGDRGVRLVFSIEEVQTDLRQIYYRKGARKIPLLESMMGIAAKYDRFLVFEGLSKIGFFYLPGTFQMENEARLLIKREQAIRHGLTVSAHPAGYEFLELPFQSALAKTTLKRVVLGRSCPEDKVRDILHSKPGFESVQILSRTI